ncbi:MAG: DUF4124 domain-containing protein [Xanthomonadales bacterium]|jgi:hypothetical protein|nr:DUF4124 domain-containing protein [Xanthomonadales bacterium]
MASRQTRVLLLALLCGLAALTVHAGEVYRWVDENGVVNFSQTAPTKPEADIERFALEDTRPSDYDPDQDFYGVAEQAERMKALREDMETKRQERLKRQRETANQTVIQYRQPERYGFPVFWNHRPMPEPPPRPVPPIDLPGPVNPPPSTLLPRPR